MAASCQFLIIFQLLCAKYAYRHFYVVLVYSIKLHYLKIRNYYIQCAEK